ncbi:MAG: hypothetical protein ACK514_04705 [Bacteroidota bacterium]|jgi:hypothetical protein|nr:hypothetical protein [Cytophagales bacterium]
MRNIIVFLIFITVNAAYSQTATNTEAKDTSNVYHQALKIYVKNLAQSSTENYTLLIEKNYLFTDRLPKQLEGYKIEYLDGYDINEKLKRKNPITVIRIIPLRLEKGVFFINIIPFTVKKESKRNIRYINSGGDGIIFDFDCSTNTFRFKRIEHGNI